MVLRKGIEPPRNFTHRAAEPFDQRRVNLDVRCRPLRVPAAIIALGLGGLPLTGGALAKLAIKPPLGDGVVGTLAMFSAAGSTLLMLHFLRRLQLSVENNETASPPAALIWTWLAIALAAVALPWALYPAMTNTPWSYALTPKLLWESLWPVLVGGLLTVALQRWGRMLPAIPAGDLLAADKVAAGVARRLGAGMERTDWYLRQWPVAGALFLFLATVLACSMFAGR